MHPIRPAKRSSPRVLAKVESRLSGCSSGHCCRRWWSWRASACFPKERVDATLTPMKLTPSAHGGKGKELTRRQGGHSEHGTESEGAKTTGNKKRNPGQK